MKRLLLFSFLVACSGGSKPTSTAPPDRIPADVPPPDVAKPPPALATGKPKADLIPRSVLFGNPERAAVKLSPDGKWLSWVAPKDGVMNVWVAPIDKPGDAKVVTADKTRPITDYFWAHTNKHILYTQDKDGDENTHIFRVDLAAGNKIDDLTPVKGALAGVAWASHTKPTKLIIEINDRDPKLFDLHELDVVTGKRTLMLQNDQGFIGFSIDHSGKVRFAQKRTDEGTTEIHEYDGKAWKLFDKIPFEDAESTGIAGFTPDNKGIYLNETRNRDTGAFVLFDLATKKKTVVAEDPKADIGGVMMHPTKRTIEAVSFEYERIRWKVLDKAIEKDLAALAKLTDGDAHVASRTVDDKLWIVVTTSEQKPAHYHLWDRAKQKATFLFSLKPELDKQPLVKMHPVVLKSRDNLDMVSYLTLPAAADPDGDGKPNAPVPILLYVHGGPWARDSWGFDPIHQLMANRGYAVLAVNYRGSTGFGKKYRNAADKEWGRKMHDDLIDAVEWAVKSGVAPRDKIAIGGGSYGGYATLVGLAMTPDVFACGIDLVGVANLQTFIASIPEYWKPFLGVLRARVGDPETQEGKQLLIERSPLTHADKIKRPLLIGQGANDPRVKQAESEQIVAAMQKHRLPVTYALFPDEGHGFARPENNVAFFAISEAFLSAHLGGFYQPLTKDEIGASSMQIKIGKEGIPGMP